ncbi:hypothetical protein ACKKBG_A29835 [Auxenochlorella protothecoides x Auxenochlorella symbiontica]
MDVKVMDAESGVKASMPSPRRGWVNAPLSQLPNKSDAIRNFSPSLYIASTCTGLIGILIDVSPYLGRGWAVPTAWAFWWLSLLQFTGVTVMILLRVTRFWGSIASLPSSKSVDLFFFGAVAISVAILSEGFVRYMTHYFGSGFLVAGPALWWATATITVLLNVALPFLAIQAHSRELPEVLPIWIVAFVPGVVTGSVGPIMASVLTDLSMARHMIYMSYILVGLSFPIVFIMLTIVVMRLLFHGLPPPPLILSLFFPVAPLTLMGDALVELAHGSIHAFPQDSLFNPFFNFAHPGLTSALMAGGLFFFGAAVWWALFAALATVVVAARRRGLAYTVAWWGSVFPLGLLGLTALRLGTLLDVAALEVVGTVLSISTAVMWLTCSLMLAARIWDGSNFARAL